MATCIRCGVPLPAGEASCPSCGALSTGQPAVPVGTWGEARDVPEAGEPRPASRVLTVHEGGQERAAARARRLTPSEVTPLPGSALAIVAEPGPQSRAGAEVVPLRPRPDQVDEPDVAAAEREPEPAPEEARPPSEPPPARSAARRPPILASESLREDLEPTDPGRAELRVVGTVLGLAGAVGSFALGGPGLGVLLGAAALACVAIASATPMSYGRRGFTVAGIVAAGLVATVWARLAEGAAPATPLLAVGTVLLGGGLLFRAAWRASHTARLVVALGMAAVAVWFGWAGGILGMTNLDMAWQSWAPAVLRVGFVLLLLFSLLAFMDATSTAGARVWGGWLLAWYGLHVGVESASLVWPQAGGGSGLPSSAAGLAVADALLVSLGAVALVHVQVTLVRRFRRRGFSR